MDFATFLAAVARMRKLQRETRDPTWSEECKRAERAIDAELAAREAAKVPSLFDVIDNEG